LTGPRREGGAPATVRLGRGAATERERAAFARKYRTEMAASDASKALDLLAALSRRADFSVACYCEDEARCHRSILRSLLDARGARLEG
jgi:uncharacterized protein YeaO (DUF488 family)